MKKHSPNFHENLHEADTSTFDRGAACIWTIVLIIVTVLLFSVTAKAQKSADATYLITNYRLSGKEISAEEYYKHAKKRYLFGSVIDDGSELQIFKQDTTPVVMMVSDTTESKYIQRQVFSFSEIELPKKDTGGFSIISFGHIEEYEIKTPVMSQSYIIYGYQVIERYTHTSYSAHHTSDPFYICMGCTQYKTTYLNHLKQPLPERLIVWMAGRRKER